MTGHTPQTMQDLLTRLDLASFPEGGSSELDHYIAVVNWLTDYVAGEGASYREQVEGYLQAIHHLCQVEAWARAGILLLMPLERFGYQELRDLLRTWGCFEELIQICQHLLGKVDPSVELCCRYSLGGVYYLQSRYEEARACCEAGLAQAEARHEEQWQIEFLHSLGNIFRMMGQYQAAISWYERGLSIVREQKDDLASRLRMSLAHLHIYIRRYDVAENCYRQELLHARRAGSLERESIARTNLALLAICCGEYTKAIRYSKQSVRLTRSIGFRFQEGWALGNWGKALLRMECYPKAEKLLQEALKIFQELACRRAESELLETLGELYWKWGYGDKGRAYYQQALAICTELGVPLINPTSEDFVRRL